MSAASASHYIDEQSALASEGASAAEGLQHVPSHPGRVCGGVGAGESKRAEGWGGGGAAVAAHVLSTAGAGDGWAKHSLVVWLVVWWLKSGKLIKRSCNGSAENRAGGVSSACNSNTISIKNKILILILQQHHFDQRIKIKNTTVFVFLCRSYQIRVYIDVPRLSIGHQPRC